MDSLSQAALGAAVAVAVMGRRTAVWKAAAWGAVAGTLPDLDVLFDQGDPILNMVLHRAETHALFWLALFSLPFAWLVAQLSREGPLWRRWWAAMAAALITHPLLDAVTVYGTQLALPFSNHPFGVGSLFIIDPAYTLPLLLGVALLLWWHTSSDGDRRLQQVYEMMGKGGMPDPSKMTPDQLEEAARGMKQGLGQGGGFPGMPKGLTLPSGLSGLMKKK